MNEAPAIPPYTRFARLPLAVRLAILAGAGGLLVHASGYTSPPGDPSFARSYLFNFLHVPLYGLFGLGVLCLFGEAGPRRRWAWVLTVLIVLAAGVADEWHQLSVPGRTSACQDLGSDLVGALAVLVLAQWASSHPLCWSEGAHKAGLLLILMLGWGLVPVLTQPLPLPFTQR